MKNIILTDCNEREIITLKKAVEDNINEKFLIKSYISNWKRTNKISEIRRYLKYFIVPIKYFLCRKKYKYIIGWQQFYALIYCFYCAIFHVKKRNVVIALNFTYKNRKKNNKLYDWFMKMAITTGYLDYLHVPSEKYAQYIIEKFKIDKKMVLVATFGIDDEYEIYSKLPRPKEFENEKYALAIGRSNRDFNFLIDNWKPDMIKLVIISDIFKGNNKNKCNIIIKNNIYGEESYQWIMHSEMMLIPILESNICSGDTVLLKAMMCKKKIIITKPSTLSEMYIKDGFNGYAIEKNKSELYNSVKKCESNNTNYLKQNARDSFLTSFSRYSLGVKVGKLLGKLEVSDLWNIKK